MPEVIVQLCGRYDIGYTVTVSPWQVVVSKKGDGNITWRGSHPLKITHEVAGLFEAPADGQYKETHHTGAVKAAAAERNYKYEISILAEKGHILTSSLSSAICADSSGASHDLDTLSSHVGDSGDDSGTFFCINSWFSRF